MSVLSSESPSSPQAAPSGRLGLYDTWWTVAAASVGAGAGLVACAWVSAHLQADAALHTVALFAHLAFLVLGFGAVLVADYYALLFLTRRCTLREAVHGAGRLHVPIWTGLAGLVASGVMLHPDLGSTLTRVKLGLVIVLTLNGLQAGLLNRRLAQPSAAPGSRLLLRGTATALVSQLCWWGAVVIGFSNSRH